MSAREYILAAIGGPARAAGEIELEAAALLTRVAAVRPDRVGGSVVDTFLARVTAPAIGASVRRVESPSHVPGAVHDYLTGQGLQARIALQPHPQLQALDWSGVETHRDIGVDEPVSVCIAPYAVAETGSLVMHSGAHMPVLFAFLPLHHIVVLDARHIVPWLEDCAALEAAQSSPHKLILITGPSGTTDIEGTLVRGAHGPAHLHVILIGSSTQPPS